MIKFFYKILKHGVFSPRSVDLKTFKVHFENAVPENSINRRSRRRKTALGPLKLSFGAPLSNRAPLRILVHLEVGRDMIDVVFVLDLRSVRSGMDDSVFPDSPGVANPLSMDLIGSPQKNLNFIS